MIHKEHYVLDYPNIQGLSEIHIFLEPLNPDAETIKKYEDAVCDFTILLCNSVHFLGRWIQCGHDEAGGREQDEGLRAVSVLPRCWWRDCDAILAILLLTGSVAGTLGFGFGIGIGFGFGISFSFSFSFGFRLFFLLFFGFGFGFQFCFSFGFCFVY
jgi:hypothetical protein